MLRPILFLAPLLLTASAHAQDPVPAAPPAQVAKAPARTDGYPLDTCIVSGKALPADAPTIEVEGRTYKTCCKKCPAKIEADPATYATKLDAAVVAAQQANYPLTKCVVSGKALDAMGGPKSIVLEGMLVQLCCGNCTKKATARKEEILADLHQAAVEKQRADYAVKTCPVSDHDLDADAIEIVHGNTLVKLCCEDCIEKFETTPNAIAARITAANAEARAKQAPEHGKDKAPAPPTGGK